MTQNANLAALSEAGVSVWLDDLSRTRIDSGNLAELIETRNVVGVTTNPTILYREVMNDEERERLALRMMAVGFFALAVAMVVMRPVLRARAAAALPVPALDLAALGSLTFTAPDEARWPALRLARQVAELAADADRFSLPAPDGVATLGEVIARLGAANIDVADVALRKPSLDDVFLALTGHHAAESVQ